MKNILLKELEDICYDSSNMHYLLNVIEKGTAKSQDFTGEDNLQKNITDIHGALSLISKIQDDISDRIWDLYDKLEKIDI